MGWIEHRITKTPELAKELTCLMKEGKWSLRRLALAAGVSHVSVSNMLNPNCPRNVRKELATKVIEVLAPDDQQIVRTFGLAGISVWYSRLNPDILFKLL